MVDVKLERYMKKPWGTYPRCQYVDDYSKQCKYATYSNDLCYGHFQDHCAGRIALPRFSASGDPK